MSYSGERDFSNGIILPWDGAGLNDLKTFKDVGNIMRNFREVTIAKLLPHGLTEEEITAFFLDPIERHPNSDSRYFFKGRIKNSEILGAATTQDTYSSQHYHPKGLGERYCVIGGRIIVVMGGQDFPLEAGDILDIPALMYHHVYTEINTSGVFLIHMKDAFLFPPEKRHLGRREAPRRLR